MCDEDCLSGLDNDDALFALLFDGDQLPNSFDQHSAAIRSYLFAIQTSFIRL